MSTSNLLYALQKIDTALFTFRKELNEIQQALKEPVPLITKRNEKVELTTSLSTLSTSVKDSELAIGTLQEKLNRSTERLYSGKVKNPKELGDLESEVNSLNGRKDTMELELMELMEEQELTSEILNSTQDELGKMEEDWAQKSQNLRIQQGEVALKMKELLGKRKGQAEKIDQAVLTQYQKLLQSKGGVGIVKLNGNVCTGCKIGMDGGTVRQINSGKLINCPNCGRFLIRE